MKLEEILHNYLPYGLNGIDMGMRFELVGFGAIKHISEEIKPTWEYRGDLSYIVSRSDCKPIFHPMPDLNVKRILESGVALIPIMELYNIAMGCVVSEDYCKMSVGHDSYGATYSCETSTGKITYSEYFKSFQVDSMKQDEDISGDPVSLKLFEKLYEWHFALDLPQELWVDINTLNN